MITEQERRYVVEMIEQALVEMEESDQISQGAIDGLVDALKVLGVEYEFQQQSQLDRDEE